MSATLSNAQLRRTAASSVAAALGLLAALLWLTCRTVSLTQTGLEGGGALHVFADSCGWASGSFLKVNYKVGSDPITAESALCTGLLPTSGSVAPCHLEDTDLGVSLRRDTSPYRVKHCACCRHRLPSGERTQRKLSSS